MAETHASTDATFEQRLQRLEDITAIQKLTATYGHFVDFGLEGQTPDAEGLRGVFAEDATWYSTSTDITTTGRDAIIDQLSAAPAGMTFAMHSFTNPIVDVDGDVAAATYLLWVGIDGNEVFQRENLTYTRSADGWVIQSIDLRFGRMLLPAS